MPKDRLSELQATLEDDDSDTEEDFIFLDLPGSYMDEFFEQVNEIRQLIDKLEENVEQVKSKQSAILSNAFPDEKTKQELEDLKVDIKSNANKVRVKLKAVKEDEGIEESSTLSRIRVTQQFTMTTEFVKIMTDYSGIQVDYRERCISQVKRQLEIEGETMTDDELEEIIDEGKIAVFDHSAALNVHRHRRKLRVLQKRYSDILQLERSVNDLNDMFVNMLLLVENQGSTIDSIELSMRNTEEYISRTVKTTEKAVKLKKKGFFKVLF